MLQLVSRALLISIAVSACGGEPPGKLYRTTVQNPNGSYAQEVVLGDQTGLVVGVDPSMWDGRTVYDPPTVVIDAQDPMALIFRWANGACDHPAITFSRSGDRFALRVDPRESSGTCVGILLYRAVRIRLTDPISPDQIDIRD